MKIFQQARRVLAGRCGPQTTCRRGMMRMLMGPINALDTTRRAELGPDRACAEWILRCGGSVKWRGNDGWENDYNELQRNKAPGLHLDEINCDEASLLDVGFEHLAGCEHLRRVRFHNCYYVDCACLHALEHVAGSLQELEVSSCPSVSDQGIFSLAHLSSLRLLRLVDLPGVSNETKLLKHLEEQLPECKVRYDFFQKQQ